MIIKPTRIYLILNNKTLLFKIKNRKMNGIASRGPLLADKITANVANIAPAKGRTIDAEVFFA